MFSLENRQLTGNIVIDVLIVFIKVLGYCLLTRHQGTSHLQMSVGSEPGGTNDNKKIFRPYLECEGIINSLTGELNCSCLRRVWAALHQVVTSLCLKTSIWKLHYTESDHWPMYPSSVCTDWQQHCRFQAGCLSLPNLEMPSGIESGAH